MSTAEGQAREAVTKFVCRSLALLAWTPRQGIRAQHHGSGCLIVGGDGTVWVLTAEHLFAPALEPVSIITDDGFCANAIREVIRAPDHLDVALARVADHWAEGLLARCIAPTLVEAAPRKGFSFDGKVLVAAGFPNQFRFDRRGAHGTVDCFVDMVRFSDEVGLDDRAITVSWHAAKIKGETFPHQELGIQPDTLTPLKKPKGISGGPVYAVSQTQKNALWSPGKDARLVGVAVAYNHRREQVVPYWRWRDWFYSVVAPAAF